MIKKISWLIALLLVTTFVSCSSDDNGGASSANASFSATIDGQAWQSMNNGTAASISNFQIGVTNQTVLQIIAVKADQSTVTIQFPITNLAEGTYTFTGDEGAGQLTYVASFGDLNLYTSTDTGGSFSVTLTDVNIDTGKISGTFSGTLVDFMGTDSLQISNGEFENVSFITSDFYSNGTLSLSKNGSDVFTMDDNSDDGKYNLIYESSFDNSVSISGYNSVLDNTFGIYELTLPKDVEAGTYNLTNSEGFSAAFAGNGDTEYSVTSGSITIVSHVGNNIVATFNYTATDGTNTAVITEGELNFTHNN